MSEATGTLKLSTSFTLAEEVNYIAIGGEKFALSLSAYAARIPDYEFTFLILNPQVIVYNQPFVDFRIRLGRAAVIAAVLSKIILSIQFSKSEILNLFIFILTF